MSNTDDLPKCMAESIAIFRGIIDDIMDHLREARDAEEIQAMFCGRDYTICVSADYDAIRVGVYNVQHFSQITPILRALAARGYRQVKKPEDYPESNRRTWYLGKIHLIVGFANGPCGFQRRQVGLRVHEIPEYTWELRCEDGARIEESEPAEKEPS